MATVAPPGPDPTGLSSAEVTERVERGDVNVQPSRTSRTAREIVRANVFTRFNLIVSVLAAVVIAAGQPGDALFAGVMVVNTSVGIVQEIRAKRTLDRVRLLVVPLVTVRRDGSVRRVDPADVVVDDVIELTSGDQIAVDGELVRCASLEVDESALTGESEPVVKQVGDEVLSGSVVVSGEAVAVATRVGERAWIHQLVTQAREFALASSELRSGVDQILRVVGWLLVPLSALLLWSQLRANDSLADGLVATVAGAIALVPQGLVLLVSMALAVAIIRLAGQHVVVQELHAVEGLARIDMFCVDKTGTLTTGAMTVASFEVVDPADSAVAGVALATIAAAEPRPNTTLRVIADHVGDVPVASTRRSVAFSSARKWSAVELDQGGPDRVWVLGAPEVLLEHVPAARRSTVDETVAAAIARAERVVVLASSDGQLLRDALPPSLVPRAVVSLTEQLRPDAAETMAYFARQGVTIKVISGDHPATVSAAAGRIGIEGADRVVDMRSIDTGDRDALDELVRDRVVFGRVLPGQKRDVVEALRRRGHHVAMTGDGVNDIPALKAADIGVAMDTATPATKAVSQLVLLDGRFDRMPSVVAEGRRVVANMERVSTLFLTKTVYAALFVVAIGVSGSVFPFLPRQMSLVSEITIGLPAFALSFRSADRECRPGYLRRVMRFAVPAGVAAASVTLAAYWLARSPLGGADLAEARSAATLTLVVFAWWVLVQVMRPLDRWDIGLLAGLVAVLIGAVAFGPARDFYRFEVPSARVLVLTAAAVVGGIALAESVLRSTRWMRARGPAPPGEGTDVRL